MVKVIKTSVFLIACFLLTSSAIMSRMAFEPKEINSSQAAVDDPYIGYVNHRIGNIVLAVSNVGTFGVFGGSPQDYFTGDAIQACEYPKNSRTQYLYAGAFWIGAVVGRDTLVSEGADGWSRQGYEFVPPTLQFYEIKKRSLLFPDIDSIYDGAVSEEDYIAVYQDTSTTYASNDYFGRQHRPLNIEIQQNTYAWSYSYAEDFVLFDYKIKNIGTQQLKNTYMGIYVDGDVGYTAGENSQNIHTDDICGFIETFPDTLEDVPYIDTVNLAWIADNEGDPKGANFDAESVPDVTATRIVRTPADELDVSFNWWVSHQSPGLDYGPREKSFVGRYEEEFRDFGTGALGTPEGDVNKYYQMRNLEFDFDQIYTSSIRQSDSLWVAPNNSVLAEDIADGYDTRYLLSFGPFNIDPGEVLPVSLAYIGGTDFHQDGNNGDNLPGNPTLFYNNLDPSDLAENSKWASWVYDNPGVDTDGDGFYGDYLHKDSIPDTTGKADGWIITDSVPFRGDGVPDFKGASPPPAPTFWLEPALNSIKVRFNGLASETTEDVFSRIIDFEGYRIYFGRDSREESFTLYTSYDVEDYSVHVFDSENNEYDLMEAPMTLEELEVFFDSTFNPLDYGSPFDAYYVPGYVDSSFYFTKQGYNVSEFGVETKIEKTYPDEPYPSTLIPDSADASELTEDGYLKYFEYNATIDNLLPTVPWYISVTTFDFGSPSSGLEALETAKSLNVQNSYALYSEDEVDAENLPIYVYPNPYRIDGAYLNDGFERITSTQSNPDRIRQVHFVNLPAKCTIRIYTLDGDLVQEIDHDKDPSDPNFSHDTWNLITRNTQLAVSGLYYWTVEQENGETEIGKLVLIM